MPNSKVYNRKQVAPKRPTMLSRRWLLIIAALLILVAAGLAFFFNRSSDSSSDTSTTSTHTKPRPTSDKTNANPAPTTPTPPPSKVPGGSPTPTTPPANNIPAAKPYGSFVSNHKPGQNGSPLVETSVCNTSPQVPCTITFTKDGVTKSLPAQTTDNSGATIWDSWTLQSVGLTAGSWTISAVAGSGTQATTTQDPIALEIQ